MRDSMGLGLSLAIFAAVSGSYAARTVDAVSDSPYRALSKSRLPSS